MTLIKSAIFILWTTNLALAGGLTGTWVCDVPNQEGGIDSYALVVEPPEGATVQAQFISFVNFGHLIGKQQNDGSRYTLSGKTANGTKVSLDLSVAGQVLKGTLHLPDFGAKIPFTGKRSEVEGSAAIGMYPAKIATLESVSISQSDLREGLEAKIIERLGQAINDWAMVGLSVGLIRDGVIADIRSYGWENHKAQIPATGKTMYRWASLAKPLTAIIAMQLAEEGQLDLDRDIRAYLPEYPEQTGVITSRHLLNHTSGIVHYQAGKVIPTRKTYTEPHPFGNVINALDKFNRSQLLFAPGEAFSYSTPGYVLLGAVLQRVARMPFAELIEERVSKPLGMSSLQPDHDWVEIPHRSVGYHRIGEGLSVNTAHKSVSWKLPAGGLISHIGDLALFAQGILNQKLLSKNAWQTMWQPTELSGNRESQYGFGFTLMKTNDQFMVGHSGAQNKTATYMLLNPATKTGVVIMCNTQGTRHEQLAADLMGILLEKTP